MIKLVTLKKKSKKVVTLFNNLKKKNIFETMS